jgi:hypothetical protein
MTGPVRGRIIDPEGEVAEECLEGAWIDIVEGTGMGQLRRITGREGDRIEIDRPWRYPPDETSNVVFTAPAPFRNLTIVDNRIVSHAVNLIAWGMSRDTVVDGNYVSGGPGITIWSVRLAPDQKVWGGAFFTTIMNNIADGCRMRPGIGNLFSWHPEAVRDGYDWLGCVIRDNYCVNNSPIEFRKRSGSAENSSPASREAGVVLEENLVADGIHGVLVHEDARAVCRRNTLRNIEEALEGDAAAQE